MQFATLTNSGISSALSSEDSNFTFKSTITGFKLSDATANLVDASLTNLPGTIVHQSTNLKVKRLNDNYVLVTVVLDTTIGDFSYGCIGFYTDTGELFSYAISKHLTEKRRENLPTQLGNRIPIRFVMGFDNLGKSVVFPNIDDTDVSLPEVLNTSSLPNATTTLKSLYIVKNHVNYAGAVLAYSDGYVWKYTSLTGGNKILYSESSIFSTAPTTHSTSDNSIALGGKAKIEENSSYSLVGPKSKTAGDNNVVFAIDSENVSNTGNNLISLGKNNSAGNLPTHDGNTIIGGNNNVIRGKNNSIISSTNVLIEHDNVNVINALQVKSSWNNEIITGNSGYFVELGDIKESTLLFKRVTTQNSQVRLASIPLNNNTNIAGTFTVNSFANNASKVSVFAFCANNYNDSLNVTYENKWLLSNLSLENVNFILEANNTNTLKTLDIYIVGLDNITLRHLVKMTAQVMKW
jgi:Phage tail-collar fibre protein